MNEKQQAILQKLGPDCKTFVPVPEHFHHKTVGALVSQGLVAQDATGTKIKLTKEGRKVAQSFLRARA